MTLARYYVARWLIHAGLWVFPRGHARSLLVHWLNAYGAEIMDAIEIAKDTPHD